MSGVHNPKNVDIKATLDELFPPASTQMEIRVDDKTQQASCIDIVRIITGQNQDTASGTVRRMNTAKVNYLRINGKGRQTPVSGVDGITDLISKLPGKRALTFKVRWFAILERYLSGDRSLCTEVVKRADAMENATTITTATTIHNGHLTTNQACALHQDLCIQQCESLKRARDDSKLHLQSTAKRQKQQIVVESKYQTIMQQVEHTLAEDAVEETARCVYFIRVAGSKYVKVGYTGQMEQRLANLQVANPNTLQVEFQMITPHYKKLEKIIHCHLSMCKIRGEWFELEQSFDYIQCVYECLKLLTYCTTPDER
jgi:hypothetical protein